MGRVCIQWSSEGVSEWRREWSSEGVRDWLPRGAWRRCIAVPSSRGGARSCAASLTHSLMYSFANNAISVSELERV